MKELRKLDIPEEVAALVEDRSSEDMDGLQNWVARANAAGIVQEAIVNTLVGSGWPATFVTWYLKNGQTQFLPASAHRLSLRGNVEMIDIPAGEFLMGTKRRLIGNSRKDRTEQPCRMVHLDAYQIGRTPVTVGQYKSFCLDKGIEFTKYSAPAWGWIDDHPMVYVTWQEARTFCYWAGGDLPTEAQWEKAARSADGRIYPWGNDWDDSRLRCSKSSSGDGESTAPVGSFPSGASPHGCLDMAGNACEWCLDWYQDSYKGLSNRNPACPSTGTWRAMRGGSWVFNNPDYFRCANRFFNLPESQYSFNGFRLAGPGVPSHRK